MERLATNANGAQVRRDKAGRLGQTATMVVAGEDSGGMARQGAYVKPRHGSRAADRCLVDGV